MRGTERLLAAAGALGARTRSSSSCRARPRPGPRATDRPCATRDPSRPISWYGMSKREGEQAVARAWKGPWIVLRPGVVYGPGDRGLFEYFRMAARGWVPVPAGHTRVQILGVDQAALAIARAASRRDLVGATALSLRPGIRFASGSWPASSPRLPRRPARRLAIPDAAGPARWGSSRPPLETLTRPLPPFNADKAREILAGDWLCDSAPAADATSTCRTPSPLEEGLKATWDWYRGRRVAPGHRVCKIC